ncbi:hypothetical protein [Luteolibacter soli]|uniref:Methyltransferase domain-containing protein n=1 Tax=Luteolibacter soli TaxID=3135280 RepID=A0ABU9B4M1_9BACT
MSKGPNPIIFRGMVHHSLRPAADSLREHVTGPLAKLGDVDISFHSWDSVRITPPWAGESGVVVDAAEVSRWRPEAKGGGEPLDDFECTIGKAIEMDRGLEPEKTALRKALGPRQEPDTTDRPIKERFLILARQDSPAARRLRQLLSPLGQAEIILDSPGENGIWYGDDVVKGYGGLMSNSSPFPIITAWSRAMYHLERTLQQDEAVWFVEDDVAGNPSFFEALVRETAASGADFSGIDVVSRESDPAWDHWNLAEPWFRDPWRAFKPLSRKSARLIRAALDFREKHGCFTFHEILFPTLANQADLRCLDWMRSRDFRRLLTVFRFRPIVKEVAAGVCHPVKTEPAHELICTHPQPPSPRLEPLNLAGMPRFSVAAFADWSLQCEEYAWLVRFCRRSGARTVVEIGCGNSTLALLDAGCRVLSLEADPEWRNHVCRGLHQEREVEIRAPQKGGMPRPDDVVFRPDFVLVNAIFPGRAGNLEAVCTFGLSVADQVLLHDTRARNAVDLLADLEAAGYPVRRLPSSRGLACIGPRQTVARSGYWREIAKGYRGIKNTGWFREDLERWEIWFASEEPVRALEIGASDGVSANVMLDILFTHPASEVHCVELHNPANELSVQTREAFVENLTRRQDGRGIELYHGNFAEVLAWMIASDDYWESFDFIHLAACENPPHELLSAACQGWSLLKPGGVMVFGGLDHGSSAPPHCAWSAFEAAFRDQGDVLFEDNCAAFRKIGAACTGKMTKPLKGD